MKGSHSREEFTMQAMELIQQYIENAAKVDASALVVDRKDELSQAIRGKITATDSVYCPRITALEQELDLPKELLTTDYHHASVTVEEATAGIAETGSIVCWSKEGRSLQASVLPLRHVAIVAKENVLPDLEAFFGSLGDNPPTNITIITGPSRTADIELTLTTGVHGPEFLDIIIV
jgi:L-lactate dehydrogenase complex protein LldG